MNTAVLRYIWSPEFCNQKIREKVVAVTVKTLFLHKVKMLNESVKTVERESGKTLKKICHQ